MNIYLLEWKPAGCSPIHDVMVGIVVYARTPKEAREWAAGECMDEGAGVWDDPTTTCRMIGEAVGARKSAGVILKSVVNG